VHIEHEAEQVHGLGQQHHGRGGVPPGQHRRDEDARDEQDHPGLQDAGKPGELGEEAPAESAEGHGTGPGDPHGRAHEAEQHDLRGDDGPEAGLLQGGTEGGGREADDGQAEEDQRQRQRRPAGALGSERHPQGERPEPQRERPHGRTEVARHLPEERQRHPGQQQGV
jgi:hypothetical protein